MKKSLQQNTASPRKNKYANTKNVIIPRGPAVSGETKIIIIKSINNETELQTNMPFTISKLYHALHSTEDERKLLFYSE